MKKKIENVKCIKNFLGIKGKEFLDVIFLSSKEKIVIIKNEREGRSSKNVYNTLYCVSIVYVTVKMGSQKEE